MLNIMIAYGISLLTIILGFIALLTQKIYIDPNTNQPTDIEIPFLGKMKTNIPALVFLFLGIGFAVFTFNKSFPPKKVEWTVSGSFSKPDGYTNNMDWLKGNIMVIPNDFKIDFSDKGTYIINALIDEGVNFEDEYQRIMLTHPEANGKIDLIKEYGKFTNKQDSLIESQTKTIIDLKPQPIEIIVK